MSSALHDEVQTEMLEPPTPQASALAAVVVTYFPKDDFPSRMKKLRRQVAFLTIIDNGSSGASADLLNNLEQETDVHLIRNSTNVGVGTALNQGAYWAIEKGCQWILTFDQDSIAADDMVKDLFSVYNHFPDKPKLAIVGSNYTASVVERPFWVSKGSQNRLWEEVTTTITSGSLISLSAFREIGPFRDEFFIDCIDFEFCLRARVLGFHILLTCKSLMRHSIGAATRHRLLWKQTTTSNHSPIRRYYMTRNQVILASEYFWTHPAFTATMLYRHAKDTVLFCLFEGDITKKLSSTILGLWDGIRCNVTRRLT
jgi:rhamnosyltransferase